MRKLSDDEFIKIAVTYLPYYGGRVRLIKDLVVDTGLSKREVNNLLCRFTGKLWQFERHERGIHHFLPINLSDRAIISRGNHNHEKQGLS